MSVARLWKRCSRRFRRRSSTSLQLSCRSYGGSRAQEEEEDDIVLPEEWRRAAYPRLIKLSRRLGNVDRIDSDHKAGVISEMREFKSLARALIWSSYFSSETPQKKRSNVALRSLTNICNLLEISAQQRKLVRQSISPQITEHRIWRGAIEATLQNLSAECQEFEHLPSAAMAEQIISCCLRFMADAASAETPLWMQLAPINKNTKNKKNQEKLASWGEVCEMLEHLSACLAKEKKLSGPLEKVEAMKEGLYQIKDLLLEREIVGYKEARHQDSLVQKRLCKSLGHSSRCLFILLLYYLHGGVEDFEVDLCGVGAGVGGEVVVDVGRILTSGEERRVKKEMEQLDGVFAVLKLVWETAGMKGRIRLRGHIWWSGAERRSFVYRGHDFFISDFSL